MQVDIGNPKKGMVLIMLGLALLVISTVLFLLKGGDNYRPYEIKFTFNTVLFLMGFLLSVIGAFINMLWND
jgi:hypothetical protein